MPQSDQEVFSHDPEAWDRESIEDAKARLAKIVSRNRAIRERLAAAPPPKSKTPTPEDQL